MGVATVGCVATGLWFGGTILTMELGALPVGTMAVAGDHIVAVGEAAVAECDVSTAERYDLKGRIVLPGFIDAHSHPAAGGVEQGLAVLGEAATVDEVVSASKSWLAAHPTALWIEGGGWDQSKLDTAQPLAALDAAFPKLPVFLSSSDGHSAWVNSAALKRGGLILADGMAIPDPVGGRIERDAQGRATGIIREMALDPVLNVIPNYPQRIWDVGVARAMRELAQYGITTVVDADASTRALRAYVRADRQGLGAAVHAAISIAPAEGVGGVARAVAAQRVYASKNVKVSAVKLFLDGVVESRTAALLSPYDDGTLGELQFEQTVLAEIAAEAKKAGLQLHAHAIGDAAVRQFLDVVENVGADIPPLAAHIEMIDASDISRFARLGVLANMQTLWAFSDPFIEELTLPKIGAERGARLYPFGELERAGATLVAGSDWTVTTMNPWPAIEVAVTRRDPDSSAAALGGPAQALGVGQELRVEAALAAYTRDGARAVGSQTEIGTLTAGKLANFVVVDQNPLSIPIAELSDVVVEETWFRGRAVYVRATIN